jgi:hypothetical protein
MAKVPDTANINTWEATGAVWFKVSSTSGTSTGANFNWPTYSMITHAFHLSLKVAN